MNIKFRMEKIKNKNAWLMLDNGKKVRNLDLEFYMTKEN